jgi:hypothetical protein
VIVILSTEHVFLLVLCVVLCDQIVLEKVNDSTTDYPNSDIFHYLVAHFDS